MKSTSSLVGLIVSLSLVFAGCEVSTKRASKTASARPASVEASTPAAAVPAPRAAVRPRAVEQLPRPRLFADDSRMAEVRAFCETNELGRALAARIRQRADRALVKEPVVRRVDGRRLLAVSRTALDRILNLGVAWRLTGEEKYAARGIRELEAVCAFTDWNPQHYLDVGEMAFAASVAYDWFYDEIPAERRRALAAAIDARVFGPLFADQDMNWGGLKTTWWLEADNNWNSVCAAGTMVAARALWDDPEFADRAHRAFGLCRKALPLGMKCYAPAGAYPEGPSYWGFGTAYCCIGAEMIRETTGDDSGVADLPGFADTACFPDRVTGPTGQYFNFGDNRAERRMEFATFYLAHRFNRPEALSARLLDLLRDECARDDDYEGEGVEEFRLYPLIAFYLDLPLPEETRTPSPRCWYSGANAMPVFTAETADGAWFAAKGGRAKASHMHMDVGSFVYEARGRRFVIDFGWEPYPNAEARGIDIWDNSVGGKRWNCFRLGPKSHAVPLVNDELPNAQAFSPFIVLQTNALPYVATLDLTELYPSARRAVRMFKLNADGSLTVKDRFDGLKPGTVLSARFPVVRDAYVRGAKGEGGRLAIDAPGADCEILTAECLLDGWEEPVPPVDLVVFSRTVGAKGTVELVTTLVPPEE